MIVLVYQKHLKTENFVWCQEGFGLPENSKLKILSGVMNTSVSNKPLKSENFVWRHECYGLQRVHCIMFP